MPTYSATIEYHRHKPSALLVVRNECDDVVARVVVESQCHQRCGHNLSAALYEVAWLRASKLAHDAGARLAVFSVLNAQVAILLRANGSSK